MGNCIGLYNFKMFTQYLFYLLTSMGYIVLMMTNCFQIDAVDLIELMFYSLNLTTVTFIALGLWLSTIILFMIQLKLIWSNQTTLEM